MLRHHLFHRRHGGEISHDGRPVLGAGQDIDVPDDLPLSPYGPANLYEGFRAGPPEPFRYGFGKRIGFAEEEFARMALQELDAPQDPALRLFTEMRQPDEPVFLARAFKVA